MYRHCGVTGTVTCIVIVGCRYRDMCSVHVIILVLDLCKKSLSSFGKQEAKKALAESGELSVYCHV